MTETVMIYRLIDWFFAALIYIYDISNYVVEKQAGVRMLPLECFTWGCLERDDVLLENYFYTVSRETYAIGIDMRFNDVKKNNDARI